MVEPNCIVEYVDDQGSVVFRDRFYDPGLDEAGWLAREMKRDGRWNGPHRAYGCGLPLNGR